MTDYLNEFYKTITKVSRAELLGLYQKFSIPNDIKQEIRNRTITAFNKLYENPDFRLYIFYQIKNGKNIPGSLDWLTTMVGHVMGASGLKTPNTYETSDNSVAFYKSNPHVAQTLNFSTSSLESEPAEFLDTIFHEFTHELQPTYKSSNDTWNKIIQFNSKNYISHKMDAVAYRNQPVEAEAYMVGDIVQELVQEKCKALAKTEFIDYPDDNDKYHIYGFTINPYQYWDAASTRLSTKKIGKKDTEEQFADALRYLDKALDYGRFVNSGTCARDAIDFLKSIAVNTQKYSNLHKHIPNIQDRIMTILKKYKEDPVVKNAIQQTMMRLSSKKLQHGNSVFYSAPENTPGRVAVYWGDTQYE